MNLPAGGNRVEKAWNRSGGTARLENTFDYTSTSPSTMYHSGRVSPRILQKGQFSRRTEKNALAYGDNTASDNGTSVVAIGELLTSPGAQYAVRAPNEGINYNVTSGWTTKSGDLRGEAFAILSKIVLSETLPATERSEGPRCVFRTPASVSDNVNASGNAPLERRNLSAVAIRNDNARHEGMEGDANASTRILVAAAFTRSRDLPFPGEISTKESSAATVRPRLQGDPSTTLKMQDRGSLSARIAENSEDRNESPDSRGIYNSLADRTSRVVNLKNSHGSLKPREKLRKWRKGVDKFRGGKNIGRNPKRGYEDFFLSRESRKDRVDSNRHGFANGMPAKREIYLLPGRFRRHLQGGNEDPDSAVAEDGKLESRNENSRRKTQVFVDYHARPKVAHF